MNTPTLKLSQWILAASILSLIGCEFDNHSVGETVETGTVIQNISESVPQINHVESNSQFTIDNKRYLFDISEHSIEELQSLLQRADEITQVDSESTDDLKIVMILHGPDIGWFTLDKYDDNKELVDLAKKLDTYDIIDLKVCDTTMESLEIDRSQIPDFIESVPFAPNEVRRLTEDGYTHL